MDTSKTATSVTILGDDDYNREVDIEADGFGLRIDDVAYVSWEWILAAYAEISPTPTQSNKNVNSIHISPKKAQ